ncbi:ESX secretion-associated protein EspG [Pseudonocardiaceae bacterium YIM PH 21723]|nr:ESX secretion-associated protein EspG [Pseudonocardiaceae bacterium YIM PH 21723]
MSTQLVTEQPLQLTATEFDVLWEHLELGPMPLVIKVPSPGRTFTERRGIERKTWDDLEERGLGRQVGLDPMLERMLRTLARPDQEVDGRLWLGRKIRVLAATRDDLSVLAVLDGGTLSLYPATTGSLPRLAVGVLDHRQAGSGRSVTLRSADLDAGAEAAATAPGGLAGALVQRGVRPEDADMLAGMVLGAQQRGQFGAAIRDRWARRHRADRVIGFFDTERGRYAQTRRPAPDGVLWSAIYPVDDRRLIAQLEELLTELGLAK